jgi:glycosyltransferase involved in cell wall biosynthesis
VSRAKVVTLLDQSHPDEIERSLYEVDHVGQAFDAIDMNRDRFDIIHDHCGFTALAMASRIDTPIVHTLHGPFTAETAAFYARHGHKAALVGISRAQLSSAPPGLGPIDSIPNPIDLRAWPLQERKSDYLLWIGRMTPEKGPHRAIAAARAVDVPLVLAGVIQPGQQAFFDREVAPHIDGERVRFVGEVGGAAKRSLFARARGLLMPIRWNEPFGMVMVEALACGTPVIAFREGAARELIVDEKTGFLVDDERGMGVAVGRLPRIAARDCRAWVSQHCDVGVVAAAYEGIYRSVAGRSVGRALASV